MKMLDDRADGDAGIGDEDALGGGGGDVDGCKVDAVDGSMDVESGNSI